MSDNVQSAMFEILKSVQAGLSEVSADVAVLRSEVRADIAELKDMVRKQRRDIAGMLVMMKGAAGVFDERMTLLELRVSRLEAERRT